MSEVHREDEIQGKVIHVYDGIEEADNGLPRWWLLTFYGAIAFSIVYWFAYHEYGMASTPRQAYETQMAERPVAEELTEDHLDELSKDDAAVGAGRTIFLTNCLPCHGPMGQGQPNLGPNLTDAYWIHGGAALDLHKTISEGVLEKGMPAWRGPLGPEGTQQVVAFILTLRNANVEGREPQGEPWPPGSAPALTPTEAATDGGAEAAADAGAAGAEDKVEPAAAEAEAAPTAGAEPPKTTP